MSTGTNKPEESIVSDNDALIASLAYLAGIISPLPVVIPWALYFWKRDSQPYAAEHSANALAAQLVMVTSVLVAMGPGWLWMTVDEHPNWDVPSEVSTALLVVTLLLFGLSAMATFQQFRGVWRVTHKRPYKPLLTGRLARRLFPVPTGSQGDD